MSEVLFINTRVDKLHNMEHIEFHTEFIDVFKSGDPDVHRCADLLPLHIARFAVLDAELKRIVKSPRTEEIHNADVERDETYRGLVAFVKAMTLHANPTIRAAALRVQIVINTYGNVTGRNYEEETGAIYNLVEDLKSAKYAPDVATIGATQWVLTLETRNNNFKTLMGMRDEETAAAEHHIAVKDARSRLDKIYSRLKWRVNSYVSDDVANPALEAFVTQLNVVAKRFNVIIARRLKGAKPGEEEPPEPVVAEDPEDSSE